MVLFYKARRPTRPMTAPRPALMENLGAAPVKGGVLGFEGVPLGGSVRLTVPVAVMAGWVAVLFIAVGYGVTIADEGVGVGVGVGVDTTSCG